MNCTLSEKEKTRKLTEEEKMLVEKSHNLIYWYIHKHHLDLDECYDLLALRLITTAKKYLQDTNLQRYSFTTIVSRSFFSAVGNSLRKNRGTCISMDAALTDTLTLNESILTALPDDKSAIPIKCAINSLDESKRKILSLYIDGYTVREISKKCGYSKSAVGQKIRESKEYVKKALSD
jgi:RNA polymerase sigma factor (sigma-70 family)